MDKNKSIKVSIKSMYIYIFLLFIIIVIISSSSTRDVITHGTWGVTILLFLISIENISPGNTQNNPHHDMHYDRQNTPQDNCPILKNKTSHILIPSKYDPESIALADLSYENSALNLHENENIFHGGTHPHGNLEYAMTERDLGHTTNFTGDEALARRSKIQSCRAKESIDNRARYNKYSAVEYLEEELRDHANREWWTNPDLAQYM